jgi:hypothetical protein
MLQRLSIAMALVRVVLGRRPRLVRPLSALLTSGLVFSDKWRVASGKWKKIKSASFHWPLATGHSSLPDLAAARPRYKRS